MMAEASTVAPSFADERFDRPRRVRIDSRRRWFPDLRATFRSKDLLLLLNQRDITVKYRQTVLGTVWIFVTTLISAGLFTFVFGHVAGLESDGFPYFAFSYAGLIGWNVFSDTANGASKSLTANSGLISKIYFPRLALPFSTIAATSLNAGISLGIMGFLLAVYRIPLTPRLVLVPVWLVLALVLSMAMGLVLAAVSVTYRDVNQATPFLLQTLMYITPVGYASSAVPHAARPFYMLNPVVSIVDGCRWSLLGHGHLSAWGVAYSVGFTVVAVVVSLSVFARLEWSFADVV